MAPPESRTHDIAFLKQDNGELQEDIVDKETTGSRSPGSPSPGGGPPGGGPPGADHSASDPEVDEEVTESFPASDPPSYWSGDDTGEAAGGTSSAPGSPPEADASSSRLVGRAPAADVPERRHPAQPVPGTLPRPTGPGTDEDRD